MAGYQEKSLEIPTEREKGYKGEVTNEKKIEFF
jgi:hypothetical protein